MAVVLKELSEDEKIRQQLQARDDYERRLIGQYNRGFKEGFKEGYKQGYKQGRKIAQEIIISDALNLGHSAEEIANMFQIDLETVQEIQMNI